MVYGLDKMVYGLPWFKKTAIKWSTGDKMVYGLPSLDKTAIDLDKTALGFIKRPLAAILNGLRAIKWFTGCFSLINVHWP